jgi:ATP-dependent protease Clp ATPase subunit
VSGQDEAKQALVVAADSRSEGSGRILLIGPSNSAKILLGRALAHVLEAPFAASDASGLAVAKDGPPDVVSPLFKLLQAQPVQR